MGVAFVIACFAIGNLFFAKFVSYPEIAPRQITLAVEVKRFDIEVTGRYSLDLENPGSSDSIMSTDQSIVLSGWVDPNIDTISIISSKTPSIDSEKFTISTMARPDVAQHFDDAGLEFSGYVISLDKEKFGEVRCLYITLDDRARILFEDDLFSCNELFNP